MEGLWKTQAHIAGDGSMATGCFALTGYNRVTEAHHCQCARTSQPGAKRRVCTLNLAREKREGTEA